MLGGFLGRALGLYREADAAGFIMAVLGALLLLVFYRVIRWKSPSGLTDQTTE